MTSTAQRRGCSMRWPPATMRKSRRRQTTSPAFNVGPDASASGRPRSGSGPVDAPGRVPSPAGPGRPSSGVVGGRRTAVTAMAAVAVARPVARRYPTWEPARLASSSGRSSSQAASWRSGAPACAAGVRRGRSRDALTPFVRRRRDRLPSRGRSREDTRRGNRRGSRHRAAGPRARRRAGGAERRLVRRVFGAVARAMRSPPSFGAGGTARGGHDSV